MNIETFKLPHVCRHLKQLRSNFSTKSPDHTALYECQECKQLWVVEGRKYGAVTAKRSSMKVG